MILNQATQEQVKKINDKINEVESDITNLSSDVSSLNENVNSLSSDVTQKGTITYGNNNVDVTFSLSGSKLTITTTNH